MNHWRVSTKKKEKSY